jgi:hypothetical protein
MSLQGLILKNNEAEARFLDSAAQQLGTLNSYRVVVVKQIISSSLAEIIAQ